LSDRFAINRLALLIIVILGWSDAYGHWAAPTNR
jgi:hypothetical protein